MDHCVSVGEAGLCQARVGGLDCITDGIVALVILFLAQSTGLISVASKSTAFVVVSGVAVHLLLCLLEKSCLSQHV